MKFDIVLVAVAIIVVAFMTWQFFAGIAGIVSALTNTN